MKISNLERKKLFEIIQKFSKTYNQENLDEDLFLRTVYYYFLSTKQIYFMLKEFQIEIKEDNVYLDEALNEILKFSRQEPERFEEAKNNVIKKISFFFDLKYLHPFVANENDEFDVSDFLFKVYDHVNNYLTKAINNFNYNKILILESSFLTSSVRIMQELSYDLLIQMNRFIKNDVDSDSEIFSDIFDYLSSVFAQKIGINVPYIPSFLTKLMIEVSKNDDEEVNEDEKNNDVALVGKTNLTVFKEIMYNLLGAEVYFNNALYSDLELDFIEFSASLSDVYFDVLNNPELPLNKRFNLVLSSNFDVKQKENNQEYKFVDASTFGKKIVAGYQTILETIDRLEVGKRASIIVPTELLSKKGAALKVKTFLLDNNYIYAIVNLPTSIIENEVSKLSMIVLQNPEEKTPTKGIFFLNAYLDFKRTPNDKLKYMDDVHVNNISTWVQSYNDQDKSTKIVSIDDIIDNEYDLNTELYIPIKNTSKKKLSIKEMLQELEDAKNQINYLEKEIEDQK